MFPAGAVQRYEILARAGRGGMAEVFHARASLRDGTSVDVVLKRILPELARDRSYVRMFEDEARVSAMLRHPRIVELLDSGRLDGAPFLAFEHVDGFDAETALTAGPFSVDLAVMVTCRVLEALQHAHEAIGRGGEPMRIVHRDVSPANVLLSRAGQVKLADFGIASFAERLARTTTGNVKGNFLAMAPEQLADGYGPVDARADVYGAAMLLVQLAMGGHPLATKPVGQLIDHVVRGEVPIPALPDGLDAAIRKSLSVLPARRPASARELAAALAPHDPPDGERRLAKWIAARLPERAARSTDVPHPSIFVVESPGSRRYRGE